MADLLAGGRQRCPIHNRIIIWADRCLWCWPDDDAWAMSNRPIGADEVEAMSDEQADSFERCLEVIHGQHCALNN